MMSMSLNWNFIQYFFLLPEFIRFTYFTHVSLWCQLYNVIYRIHNQWTI